METQVTRVDGLNIVLTIIIFSFVVHSYVRRGGLHVGLGALDSRSSDRGSCSGQSLFVFVFFSNIN